MLNKFVLALKLVPPKLLLHLSKKLERYLKTRLKPLIAMS